MRLVPHEICIPTFFKIGCGTLHNLGEYLRSNELGKVVIYFSNGLTELFGETVFESLKRSEIKVLHYKEVDSNHIEDITKLAFHISNEAEAVIAIGGGKAIDSTKYAGFLRDIPFISIPTSSSSDCFSSSTASLLVEGKRTSVKAKAPYGIIVDLDSVKSAPEKFIYSGIGDLISNITAVYDWDYESKKTAGKIDDLAYVMAEKAAHSFTRTSFDTIKDKLFLKELMVDLAMSGIASEIAGSSAPASGSEHLISHALDKILEVPELHGIQVGIAAYIISKIQNNGHAEIKGILTDTGFFEYVKTLKMKKSDFEKAIDMAPLIKRNRNVFLHEEKYREQAKKILNEDKLLREILI